MNELLSNSLKYAFPENRRGHIGLEVREIPGQRFVLTVSDDGIGLPKAFDIKQLKSLGLQLVSDLTLQLGGELEYECRVGTEFRIGNFVQANAVLRRPLPVLGRA